MSFSLVPRYSFPGLTDITPGFLEELGLKLIMLDLDNTIAAYKEPAPPDEVLAWVSELRTHGIELYIVSNSKRGERVESFGKALGTGVIISARKPSPNGILSALKETGHTAEVSALAGDQVITDTLAANRAGVVSIIVRPRRLTNAFFALRYALEAPFRAMCKNKMTRKL